MSSDNENYYRQILATGRLEFDLGKVRNSEDELIISTLENSWNMLIRSRGRILGTASAKAKANMNAKANTTRRATGAGNDERPIEIVPAQAQLSDKEQSWLTEIDTVLIALIDQASQAGLLKK